MEVKKIIIYAMCLLAIMTIFAILGNFIYIPWNPFGRYISVLLFLLPSEVNSISKLENYKRAIWNESVHETTINLLSPDYRELQNLLMLSSDKKDNRFAWKTYIFTSEVNISFISNKIEELKSKVNTYLGNNKIVVLQIRSSRD